MTEVRTGVFGIAPGADFARAFLAGLEARFGDDGPELLARSRIMTNTRRSARRIEELFLAGGAHVLPGIDVIADMAQGSEYASPDRPSKLGRRLRVAQLVRKLIERRPDLAPMHSVDDLADALCSLMGEMSGAGVSVDDLRRIQPDRFSAHWETSLEFLRIVREHWPDDPALEPLGTDAYLLSVVDGLARRWAQKPVMTPVIVMGSTGSRLATRRLMKLVLEQPGGAVVLPGFDFDLEASKWDVIANDIDAIDHPQSVIARLLRFLDRDPGDVASWVDASAAEAARRALVSLALSPAPVTHEWMEKRDQVEEMCGPAAAGMSVMVSRSERHEVQAIVIALREAVEQGRTAALITSDGALTRRVTAGLARWGIVPDETSGRPLALTPPALFIKLVAQVLRHQRITDFASLLKHPMCGGGTDRGAHMQLVRSLDRRVLRDCGISINWRAIGQWAEDDDARQVWVDWLREVLAGPGEATAQDGLLAHQSRLIDAAEHLAAGTGSTDATELWSKAAGEKLAALTETLVAEAEAFGEGSFDDYLCVLEHEMAEISVREDGAVPDQRVLIWGQLEARVQSADLIVLGGLNEGSWPQLPTPDPWLNRSLRAELGLAVPEQFIGLSAHDFQQFACGPSVILSRSERAGNSPTIPARWLTRLQNILEGSGPQGRAAWRAAVNRGARLTGFAEKIDVATEPIEPEPRPCPSPPLEARPRKLAVTDVEALTRDPYSIYAKRILRLKPMPPVARPADVRDRGIAVHLILEEFVRRSIDAPREEWRAILDGCADDILGHAISLSTVRILWKVRLMRRADMFLENEAARRADATPRADWLEAKGRFGVATDLGEVVLSGKADRIDEIPSGSVIVYDYKFGGADSTKKHGHFSKQLPLQAHMIAQGGYGDVGPRQCERMGFVVVGDPSKDTPFKPDDIGKSVEAIWDEFLRLLGTYCRAETGYASQLYPYRTGDVGDYDHLARRGEWKDGADYSVEPVR